MSFVQVSTGNYFPFLFPPLPFLILSHFFFLEKYFLVEEQLFISFLCSTSPSWRWFGFVRMALTVDPVQPQLWAPSVTMYVVHTIVEEFSFP